MLCKLALDRHRFRSYGSPGAVLPPITWPVDQCEPVGVGLPFSGVHSGSVDTKIPYQMKAEGTWEKDGKNAVSTWEKREERKKAGLLVLGYEKCSQLKCMGHAGITNISGATLSIGEEL